ncbi:MAG: EAL domain-containing protein [Ilumatobacter sp.]
MRSPSAIDVADCVTPLDLDQLVDSGDLGVGLGAIVDELAMARSMLNEMPCAIFVKDVNAKFVSANTAMLEMWNMESRGDIQGLDDFDLHAPHTAKKYAAIDRQVIQTGEAVRGHEEAQTRFDGTSIVLRTTKLPILDVDGAVVGLMGFSLDVTDSLRVIEALAVTERRYALAAEATRDGIWEYELETDTIVLTPRCAEIFEVEASPDPLCWSAVIDRLGAEQAETLSALVDRATRDTSEELALTLHFELDDGTQRWVQLVGTVDVVDGVPIRVVGSVADITADHQREEVLRHQALHDDLTGLENRRALIAALDRTRGALLYLDLDAFKVINDSLGHQAGDEVLVAVARRIAGLLTGGARLYRLGGDEFAVVLPRAGAAWAEHVAQQINNVLRDPIHVFGLDIYSTASVGVVCNLDDGRDALGLLRDADIALYHAKGDGKARASLFHPAMRARAESALDVQMHIRRAVKLEEFELHYQPIVDARTGVLAGVEALIRWQRTPDRCEPPAAFLPYLEESKLIVGVGAWVIDQACAQMAQWRRDHPLMREAHVALNISRVQFDAPGLVDTICAAVERNRLRPSDVVVEITETAVSSLAASVRQDLEALRAFGVRVAIDDFGVGQSSLSALYELPADILKIDRSFTARIERGQPEPVTSAVLELAHSLGMTTVGEGVETAEQAAWLTERSCDRLQGYLLARPMTASEIPAAFGENR